MGYYRKEDLSIAVKEMLKDANKDESFFALMHQKNRPCPVVSLYSF